MKKKTSPDRQVQRTRQFLLNALVDLTVEKGYEKVTVQDIIDRANVGRTTFYSHFQDKEDLLLSGFEKLRDVFDDLRSESPLEKSLWDFSLALFQHAEQQRQPFKALFGKQARGVVFSLFQKTLVAYLKERLQASFPKKKQPLLPLDVFVQYLFSVFSGLLTWWLDNDISYSAEQMNEYYRKLTEPAIQKLLPGV
ncbi:MAG TPA: TetR/AcrR family transcriptional regulator [Anaerolineales bacterium]|nr:TetR/AcrR family transcriptional regulator [Anaerolineales bacterium]